MASRGFKALDPSELEIMQIIWDRGQGTVHEVLAVIRQRRAVTSAMIMAAMDRMAEKGLLHQAGKGRPGHTYTPSLTRNEYLEQVIHQLCDEVGISSSERRHVLGALDAMPQQAPALIEQCTCCVCRPRRQLTLAS
jgi:predicted transcriptional regulator